MVFVGGAVWESVGKPGTVYSFHGLALGTGSAENYILSPIPALFAIGPMTRGAVWESVAVADFAAQAQQVAPRLAK